MAEQHNSNTATNKAARRYREEYVNGLRQKELILMLYDGAIKFTAAAKDAIMEKDVIGGYQLIIRARDIVTELLCMLNVEKGGEVAANLRRLYVYLIGRLTEANFAQEVSHLDNVLTVLNNLRSAWAEIDFDKALADEARGDGQNGDNGCGHAPPVPRQNDESARILSVTI